MEQMDVPYHVVIEPQEYDEYASVISPENIYTLPFSNLGQGSIPARNWVWEHSISIGAERHWILDDNMNPFYRRYKNKRIRCFSGSIFRAAEDFVDRFENVAMAGFQYSSFAPDCSFHPPFILNTRIYSCILLKNDISHRWRGRYNEDTDLSIRILKDGWCTLLFYAFLCGKRATLSMKGGNMETLYKDDGRLEMAMSLYEQHPDITSINRKWGRWQHQVDYSSFKKNKLISKKNIEIPTGINNYGMVLKNLKTGEITDYERPIY
jgi:hypothetical protein